MTREPVFVKDTELAPKPLLGRGRGKRWTRQRGKDKIVARIKNLELEGKKIKF